MGILSVSDMKEEDWPGDRISWIYSELVHPWPDEEFDEEWGGGVPPGPELGVPGPPFQERPVSFLEPSPRGIFQGSEQRAPHRHLDAL